MKSPINKILCIVEDHETKVLLSILLETEGYEALLTSTLFEGSALMKEHQICLIIIDVKLPDGRGIDFIRQIRNAGVQTPILVLSALAFQTVIDDAIKVGANDYIIKPDSWKVIIPTVNNLCSKTNTNVAYH